MTGVHFIYISLYVLAIITSIHFGDAEKNKTCLRQIISTHTDYHHLFEAHHDEGTAAAEHFGQRVCSRLRC